MQLLQTCSSDTPLAAKLLSTCCRTMAGRQQGGWDWPARGMLGKWLKLPCLEPILLGLLLRTGDSALVGEGALKLPARLPECALDPGKLPSSMAVASVMSCDASRGPQSHAKRQDPPPASSAVPLQV